MTLKELWNISPQCTIFVRRQKDGKLDEYHGEMIGEEIEIINILSTQYPMYSHVLEVQTATY